MPIFTNFDCHFPLSFYFRKIISIEATGDGMVVKLISFRFLQSFWIRKKYKKFSGEFSSFKSNEPMNFRMLKHGIKCRLRKRVKKSRSRRFYHNIFFGFGKWILQCTFKKAAQIKTIN